MSSVDHRPAHPSRRRSLAVAGTALVTPAAYFAYVAAVRWLQGSPVNEEPLLSTVVLLWSIVLSSTGVLGVLGWYRDLRVAPSIAVGGLLLLPWGFPSVVGRVGYVSIPFVGLLLVTVVEGAVRFPNRVDRLAAGSVGRYALAAGILHFAAGFGIQIYARGFFWLDVALVGVLIYGGVYLVSGLALVATGALPVILWTRRRLVAPALLTAGWFLWGLYGTWQLRGALPMSIYSRAIDWVSLQAAPDYMLQWTVLAIGLLTVAGTEWLVRGVGRRLLGGERPSVG